MIELIKMTKEEFEVYKTKLIKSYAETLAKNLKRDIETMLVQSEQQVNGLLKDGIETKEQYLYNVIDAISKENVGILWVNVKNEDHRAFIFDIEMKKEYQGRGYGKATLCELDRLMKTMGVKQIGLNVFADNPNALRLYEKSGYVVTNMNMVKEI